MRSILLLLLFSGCTSPVAATFDAPTLTAPVYVPPTDLQVCLDASLNRYLTADVDDALADWAHVTDATYSFTHDCPSTPTVGSVTILLSPTPSPADEPGDSVTGTTHLSTPEHGATIILYPIVNGFADATIRGTIRHELGHAYGLVHDTTSPSTVMSPYIDSWNYSATITPADIAAYQEIHE